MAKKNKKTKKVKKVAIGEDLFYEEELFSFSCMGDKNQVTLLLSQDIWQPDKDDVSELRSLHVIESHAWGTDVRLPAEAARQLYHALGCILEEP